MGCVQSQPKSGNGTQNGQIKNDARVEDVQINVNPNRPLPTTPPDTIAKKGLVLK